MRLYPLYPLYPLYTLRPQRRLLIVGTEVDRLPPLLLPPLHLCLHRARKKKRPHPTQTLLYLYPLYPGQIVGGRVVLAMLVRHRRLLQPGWDRKEAGYLCKETEG